MRLWLIGAVIVTAGGLFQTPVGMPVDWVDPQTGHRVVRLTDDAGGSTLYFHDNAFSPEGDVVMFSTRGGIAILKVADIGTPRARPEIVTTGARGGYFARRSREIFYNAAAPGAGRGAVGVMAVNIDTRETRQITHARGLINADGTLSVVKNGNALDP